MDPVLYKNIMEAAYVVQLVSLQARLKAAKGFVFNSSMQVECILLAKQIAALEEALQRMQS